MLAPRSQLNTLQIENDLVVYLLLRDDYMINWRVVALFRQLSTIPIKYDLVFYPLLHDDCIINCRVVAPIPQQNAIYISNMIYFFIKMTYLLYHD